MVLSFKKGGCAPAVWGITLLSLPGKVYAGVLERRIHPLVKHQIEDVQCSFRPGHRTLALYPLEAIRGCVGVGEVLCGLGEGIRLQSLGCPVNGALELLAILPLSKGS